MSDSGSQAPGWYYAQGDPPGTQRYWDGTGWQGGPQPVAGAGGAVAGGAGATKAENGDRFVAFLIDAGIFVAMYIIVLILVGIGGAISDGLGAVFAILGGLAYLGYWVYNWIYLQGTTGQTIGKKMRNIKLVSKTNGEPLGMLMVFVRGIVSAIFAIPCYLDHWWILVDENNQRLSDNVLGNHVVPA